MKAVNIEWDIDKNETVDLPSEIEIPDEVIKGAGNYEEAIERASDYLTEETGFCHKGFEGVTSDKDMQLINENDKEIE